MVIDCKSISEDSRKRIKSCVEILPSQPVLAIIQVGNNSASNSYIKGKTKAIEDCGMRWQLTTFDENLENLEEELINKIDEFNNEKSINGILVQLPLPKVIDVNRIMNAIHPMKDVDCFTSTNTGNLIQGKPLFLPCTPAGIITILKNITELDGKKAVVIGRSNIVGKPISSLLIQENCTVTICHTHTSRDLLINECRSADIIIVATGHVHTLTKEMVSANTIVIDVGVNRIEDNTKKSGFRLVGDADFEDIEKIDGVKITPVPGGVGPMTITMLLNNLLNAYGLQNLQSL